MRKGKFEEKVGALLQRYRELTSTLKGKDAQNNFAILLAFALGGKMTAWGCARMVLEMRQFTGSKRELYLATQKFRSTVGKRIDDLVNWGYLKTYGESAKGKVLVSNIGLSEKGLFLVKIVGKDFIPDWKKIYYNYPELQQSTILKFLVEKYGLSDDLYQLAFVRPDREMLEKGMFKIDQVSEDELLFESYLERRMLFEKGLIKPEEARGWYTELGAEGRETLKRIFRDPEFRARLTLLLQKREEQFKELRRLIEKSPIFE